MKKIVVNLSNKVFYSFLALFIILALSLVVYAYNSALSPEFVGHSYNEIQRCPLKNQVLKMDSDNGKWVCATIMETLSCRVNSSTSTNLVGSYSSSCNSGEIATGGSCKIEGTTGEDDIYKGFEITTTGITCYAKNEKIKASVICCKLK